MQYRTRKVEKVAKASDKILATLYPEEVKKELIRDAQQEDDKKNNIDEIDINQNYPDGLLRYQQTMEKEEEEQHKPQLD